MKFDTRGQNLTTQNEKWPLCTKMSLSVHVRQHSKASELNFPEKSFSRWKIAPGSHLRQKSISLKIWWWRHNHVKWPKLTRNIKIQLIQSNLYQKRENQYAYAILKHSFLSNLPIFRIWLNIIIEIDYSTTDNVILKPISR